MIFDENIPPWKSMAVESKVEARANELAAERKSEEGTASRVEKATV